MLPTKMIPSISVELNIHTQSLGGIFPSRQHLSSKVYLAFRIASMCQVLLAKGSARSAALTRILPRITHPRPVILLTVIVLFLFQSVALQTGRYPSLIQS